MDARMCFALSLWVGSDSRAYDSAATCNGSSTDCGSYRYCCSNH